MQPLKGLVWGCALAALAALANPAHAGWNNVFQVCCSSCGSASPAPTVAGFGDPNCCTPPPTQICTTRYIQRTFYQPVTTYRMSTYYQPVTSFRTSYFYEPVCSYRYSCYFDPCTCSFQRVATPVTSFRLRSKCCPVTTYLQRTCMTPVTTYRQMCYYEPVTSCCQTSAAPAPDCPPGSTPPATSGAEAAPAPPSPPMTGDAGDSSPLPPAPPGTAEKSRSPAPYPPSGMTPADEMRRRNNAKPPIVRFDRIASRNGHNVEGRMVDGDRQPLASARVLFVSVERKSNQQTATTDRDGTFQANLSEGAWLVYTYDNSGKPVYSRRVEVPAGRPVQFTLVHR